MTMLMVFDSNATKSDVEEAKHGPGSVAPPSLWIWEEIPDAEKETPTDEQSSVIPG